MAITTSLTNTSVESFLQNNFTISEISDVNSSAAPTLDHVLVGDGSEWVSQLLAANLQVLVDNTSIGTQPAVNFLNGGSTVITAIEDGGNNEIDVTIDALAPSQNLSDVSDTQVSLTNLLDTSNTITTTGKANVGSLEFNGSLYYSINEQATSTNLVLEENTGTALSSYFQVIDPDGAAATINVDLPAPAVGSTGLTYLVYNSGSVESIDVRNSGAVVLSTIAPGEQVKAIWAETAATWILV